MKLKTRLMIITSLAVLAILAVAEFVSYQHTAAFLKEHTSVMELEAHGKGVEDMSWHIGKDTLLSKLAALHILHAGLTLLALVVVLNLLWRRFFLSPFQDLLSAINSMGRGNWDKTIDEQRSDEMGELIRAFNQLGLQLTFTVRQFGAASKLSAMALVGNSLSAKLKLAQDEMNATCIMLQSASEGQQPVPASVLQRVNTAICILDDIRYGFDEEFDRQFRLHTLNPGKRVQDGTAV